MVRLDCQANTDRRGALHRQEIFTLKPYLLADGSRGIPHYRLKSWNAFSHDGTHAYDGAVTNRQWV